MSGGAFLILGVSFGKKNKKRWIVFLIKIGDIISNSPVFFWGRNSPVYIGFLF